MQGDTANGALSVVLLLALGAVRQAQARHQALAEVECHLAHLRKRRTAYSLGMPYTEVEVYR